MSFGIFLYGNCIFLLTLFAVSFPLGALFKKRAGFLTRVGLSALLAIPVLLVTFAYYRSTLFFAAGAAVFSVISVANYLLLFVVSLAVLLILFDEPFWQMLLCAVTAYAVQHIISNVVLFARVAFGLDELFADGNAAHLALYFGVQLIISALVYIVLYFVFIRRVNGDYVSGVYTRGALYTSLMTLIAVLVLNLFRDLYGGESTAMNVVCGLFSILSCSFILLVYSSLLTQNRLRAEYETVTKLWSKDKKQYELAKDSIEMINIKCHDLRKRFDLYEEQGFADKAEMEKLKNSIAIYDASLKTGNTALDTILMEYLISCERHNIHFTCIGDGSSLDFMPAEDIYSLFSNLISNAMEAVQKIADPEKRVIALAIRPQSGVLSVRMENYFEGDLELKDGEPVTTKADKESHGFGIKSMKILVEKYGGVLSFDKSDGVFTANIIFPMA